MSQQGQALLFAQLHQKHHPVVLYNIWDAGSALAVEQAGAKAIATGSWSCAAAGRLSGCGRQRFFCSRFE